MKTFAFIPSPENYMSVNVLDWHLPLSIFTRRKMPRMFDFDHLLVKTLQKIFSWI